VIAFPVARPLSELRHRRGVERRLRHGPDHSESPAAVTCARRMATTLDPMP